MIQCLDLTHDLFSELHMSHHKQILLFLLKIYHHLALNHALFSYNSTLVPELSLPLILPHTRLEKAFSHALPT